MAQRASGGRLSWPEEPCSSRAFVTPQLIGRLSMPVEPTVTSLTDEQLARQAQQGCSASFEELARRYQVPLLHFLKQRAKAADAEDLLQDTLLRAYENLARYRPKWPFATWLFTIARRLSINAHRRRCLATNCEALASAMAETPTPERQVADEEDRRRLWDIAEESLSEQQHATLWLYYVEEMPVKDIAQVLGRSRVAAKTMLFRARQKLLATLTAGNRGPAAAGQAENVDPSACRTATEMNHG